MMVMEALLRDYRTAGPFYFYKYQNPRGPKARGGLTL